MGWSISNKTGKNVNVFNPKLTKMKKLILLLTISLFCLSGMLAQNSWELLVTWDDDDENCYCETLSTAQFKVVLTIYDDANQTGVGTKTVYVNSTSSSYTFDCSDSPIDVEYYCDILNHENTPEFSIRCDVSFGHFGAIPEVHCSGYNWLYERSCLNFSAGIDNFPVVILL